MKTLFMGLVGITVLIPALELKQRQDTARESSLQQVIAQAVDKASKNNWYAVAVYLPSCQWTQRQAALKAVRSMGYKMAEGSAPNEIYVSWK